ncbi:uncharacterized protein LOC113799434 [Dermatophagoides pteronyssinus]|uniref:uncharacterized protein LOC113799434 n=1 Tax=Dermatophagoides pteronyssinus TaxID=6956 RepID=UPI003F677CBA
MIIIQVFVAVLVIYATSITLFILSEMNWSILGDDLMLLDSNSLDENNFSKETTIYFIFLSFVCMVFFVFTMISTKFVKSIYVNKKMTKQQKTTTDSLHLLESSNTYQNQNAHNQYNRSSIQKISKDFLPENLCFIETIGHGKYGTIWKGKFNDMTVVIKVCSDSNRKHLWTNESQIYSLPLMNHANLSNFFHNIDRIADNGQIEHCLVIEYGHYGSLQTYLAEHTFDWTRMCELFKSLVKGLAYLHTEIHDDGKIKPSIAHCDLCSANVVVKADGTCMICDFQFAVRFLPNSSYRPSLTIDDELRSGLTRYLAPEILDASINLRPTESLLKQADVYSLGLILWEIASRCTDLYQGIDVPAYKLPYEYEVGLTPTLDQMRLLVNKHKARPLFPDIWKDSNFAIRLLKETITECWDHEPEARLTSLCIDERISELPTLWKRHKMETLSSCYVIAALLQENSNNVDIDNRINNQKVSIESEKENLHWNFVSKKKRQTKSQLENSNNQSIIMPNEYSNICYINKFENSLHDKFNNHHHLLHHPHHKHYFHHQQRSLNNTKRLHHSSNFVEKNFNINNLNQSSNKLTLPIQPYHARNPCLERNLLINEIDEHDNEILEQGLKFKNQTSHQSDINFDTIIDMNLDSNEITHHNGHDSMENRSLIRSSTAPMPIPFVQNYVNSAETVNTDGDSPQPESIRIKDVNKYRDSASHQHQRSFRFLKNQNRFLNFVRGKFHFHSIWMINKNKQRPHPLCPSSPSTLINATRNLKSQEESHDNCDQSKLSANLISSETKHSNFSVTNDSSQFATISLNLPQQDQVKPHSISNNTTTINDDPTNTGSSDLLNGSSDTFVKIQPF